MLWSLMTMLRTPSDVSHFPLPQSFSLSWRQMWSKCFLRSSRNQRTGWDEHHVKRALSGGSGAPSQVAGSEIWQRRNPAPHLHRTFYADSLQWRRLSDPGRSACVTHECDLDGFTVSPFLFLSGTRAEHRAQGNTVHLLPLRLPVSDLVSCI